MRKEYETFVRSFDDLPEGVEIPLVLRDLTPGPRKYDAQHVKAIVSRAWEELPDWDILWVRSRVGVKYPRPWAVKVVGTLPPYVPGRPYEDVLAAMRRWVEQGSGPL